MISIFLALSGFIKLFTSGVADLVLTTSYFLPKYFFISFSSTFIKLVFSVYQTVLWIFSTYNKVQPMFFSSFFTSSLGLYPPNKGGGGSKVGAKGGGGGGGISPKLGGGGGGRRPELRGGGRSPKLGGGGGSEGELLKEGGGGGGGGNMKFPVLGVDTSMALLSIFFASL